MSKPLRQSDHSAAAALVGDLRMALGRLKRRLREQAGPNDFSDSQKSVLVRLDRDGAATVSALARAEGVRPQSMRGHCRGFSRRSAPSAAGPIRVTVARRSSN